MYIINIKVNKDIDNAQALFEQHAAWFKKHFQAGRFVMLGSYTDTAEAEGVIFAVADSRAELDAILAEDCYYPNLASYEIREFAPKMISDGIGKYLG